MKILTFTFVAVIATTIIGFRLVGINPTYKAARVTSTVAQGADTNNTPHQEEDLKLHQDIRILPDGAAPALNDDHQQQYHSTMSRKLDSSCDDSPLKVLTGKARKSAKTCRIIASKPKRFCKGRIIKSHCPDACGVCESFGTADSEATFLFDGGKTDCAWLHDLVTHSTLLQISMLCKVDAIRETCRHTCSFFFHSCAMCSSEPTSRPSLEVTSNMPSSSPSTSSSSSPSTLPSTSPSTSPTTSSASPSTSSSSSPSTLPSTSPSTSPTLLPSTLPSSSTSTLPSMSPSTSPTTSPSLSNSPTTQCQGKITSIIDEHFGNVTKGPPQEEAYTWLIEDITDDECDDKAKILQRYILAVLYFSAGGENWSDHDEGWLENTYGSECDWAGLYCNDNQQVTRLDLYDNNLRGTIPAELGSLTDLDYLHLGENNLSGSIPGSIFQLPQLEDLLLHGNDLTGTIPNNFGGSTSLEWISLADNLLTGTIPEITGDSLQNIKSLPLMFNKMSGPVPDSLCALRASNPNQFYWLAADCAPPNNAQNPCPSSCCTWCYVGKGLP